MLREPVERTISHYAHVRRAPDHPYHRHANCMSLREFCIHPETRSMVENYQSAFLAKAPSDPQVAAKDLGPASFARFELQEKMHSPDYLDEPAKLFDMAMRKLETCEAVGVMEDFENSLRTFSRRLGWPPPQPFKSTNVNLEKAAMSQIDSNRSATVQRRSSAVGLSALQSMCASQEEFIGSHGNQGIFFPLPWLRARKFFCVKI